MWGLLNGAIWSNRGGHVSYQRREACGLLGGHLVEVCDVGRNLVDDSPPPELWATDDEDRTDARTAPARPPPSDALGDLG
jgi:hypothetical protein